MIGLLSLNPDYDNGCYEQAYKINSVAQIVVTLVSGVMLPRNSHDYEIGNIEGMNQHIYFTSNYVWFVSLPLLVGFLVLSNNFSSWFFGEGYAEVPLLLQIMAIRLVVAGFSVILGERFIAIKKELFWTIAVGIGATVNIFVNYLMIPKYGAIGAAVATALTEIMICIAMVFMTILYKKEKISVRKIFIMSWKYILAVCAMFGIMFLMQHFMHYSVWEFIVIATVGVVLYFLVLFILRDKFLFELLQKLKKILATLFCGKRILQNQGDKKEMTDIDIYQKEFDDKLHNVEKEEKEDEYKDEDENA